jgi:EmrB/QacA subfamily drug resistance transporter
LGALILLAGSLSDLLGRKRILSLGLIGFGVTSLLCAIAPTSSVLIVARALQGIAGALIVPSSLALIMSSFSGPAQGKAIGRWTGWMSTAFIVGPLLGGLLVDTGSWRWIFAINLLPIAATLWLLHQLPTPAQAKTRPQIDSLGAVLGIIGLGAPVYALIEQPHYGWSNPLISVPLAAGLAVLGAFVWHEKRTPAPMLPLSLFRNRNFAVGNLATLAIYGGLTVSTFLIIVYVQQTGGYTAIQAGLALLPVTIMMFFLSGRFGALAGRLGPRLFMAVGPLLAAAGFLLMLRVHEQINYWAALFPGVIVFGLGLSMTVAPLTSAILGSIGSAQAGIASAVNNAVARIAGLIAIAVIGVVTGPTLNEAAFHRGVIVMAVLLAVGGIISAIGIENRSKA